MVSFGLKRGLPPGASVAVQPGQVVGPGTIIATGHQDRRALRLPPGDVFRLTKKPGDPVKMGETVAVMEEILGLGLRELVSPCDGVVESINPRRTALVLTGADSSIRALVHGTVEAVGSGEVLISVEGERLEGYFGFGRPATGCLWNAGELAFASDAKRLGRNTAGKVVLAEGYVAPEVLPALARCDAAALICGSLDFAPLWKLAAPDGPNPAGRELPTVVVLEGFGAEAGRINSAARRVLAGAEGKPVYVAGPASERLVFSGPPFPEIVVS